MRRDVLVAALCGCVAATLMVWYAAGVALLQGDSGVRKPTRTPSMSAPRERPRR